MATGLLDYLEAIGETGATLGSGAAATLAGIPYGILQNIRSGKYGTKEGVKLADKATQDFIKQYTYAPRGQMAQDALQSVAGLCSQHNSGQVGRSSINCLIGCGKLKCFSSKRV